MGENDLIWRVAKRLLEGEGSVRWLDPAFNAPEKAVRDGTRA